MWRCKQGWGSDVTSSSRCLHDAYNVLQGSEVSPINKPGGDAVSFTKSSSTDTTHS